MTRLRASHDGDVIKVQAGTYTDDFLTVNSRVTIEGVGGMVNLVGTQTPPNGKGIIVTNADLTLENFEISGGVDQWSPVDGNICAIRDQSGNLVVENCYIHDNQEGILASADLDGSVTIDHSEIAFNGSDGLTHNVYIDDVGKVVLSNSYIHDALGGGTNSAAGVRTRPSSIIAFSITIRAQLHHRRSLRWQRRHSGQRSAKDRYSRQ